MKSLRNKTENKNVQNPEKMLQTEISHTKNKKP